MAILHSIHLKKIGLNVELFYNGPIHPDWEKRVTPNIALKPLPFGLPPSFKNFRKMVKLVQNLNSFDTILVHHHICPFLAYYLTLFFKSNLIWYCGEPLRALWESWLSGMSYRELDSTVKPTSLQVYGRSLTSVFLSNPLYVPSVSFLRALDKATVQRYPKILANSKFTRKVVERIYSPETPISVVYPGVETPQNTPKTVNEKSVNYILGVGAMIPMKNHLTLLKAFNRLISQSQNKIKLILIGGGPLEKEIHSLADKLHLKNVIFRSKVNEQTLNKYYNNCSFVVHLALNEPFGLVPVEAALHGKTSIVSNNGGTSEFVTQGENGLIVNPRNPKEIAKAMKRLITDKTLLSEMGYKAKEKALTNFTIEKSTRNLAKSIKQIN